MSEIPAHVSVELAREFIAHSFKTGEPLSETIARAILSEREACAKIAEEWSEYFVWVDGKPKKLMKYENVADAIRRR